MLALYKIPQKNFYFALPSSAHVFLKMSVLLLMEEASWPYEFRLGGVL